MSRAITVRVDDTVKQQAEDMLNEIGLNMTTFINASLKALVREKKVPFALTTIQQTNAEYLAKLDKSIAEIERGETVTYTMDELKALIDEV